MKWSTLSGTTTLGKRYVFQVLVKTTPRMTGSYSYSFESRDARFEFIRRPDVFWYYFPEEDDYWRRGGAWNVPASSQEEADEMWEIPDSPAPGATGDTGDDDDAERW